MISKAVLLRNHLRKIPGVSLGGKMPTRLGLLVGITPGKTSLESELRKSRLAHEAGVSTITDVSVQSDGSLRQALLSSLDTAIGTVPAYEVFAAYEVERKHDLKKLVLSTLEKHARQGVDFFSIHISISRELVSRLSSSNRTIPITSRGGAMMTQIMAETGNENPFLEYMDDVIQLCQAHSIALSLTGTLRPGTVADAMEALHLQELTLQSHVVKKAHDQGVGTIVELLNHVPLSLIPAYCELGVHLFDGSPLGALGPSPTDVAIGFDHVAGAIGAAVAVSCGVSWVNCVTAAEHCYLPNEEETLQAIRYFKVATHVGEISRTRDFEIDKQLSVCRNLNLWREMADLSLFPDVACTIFESRGYREGHGCSMCDTTCPLVRTRANKLGLGGSQGLLA